MHDTRHDGAVALGRVVVLVSALALLPLPSSAQDRPFPEVRPTSRFEAETVVAAGDSLPLGCLTTGIHRALVSPESVSPAVIVALDHLRGGAFPPGDVFPIPGVDAEIVVRASGPTFGPVRANHQEMVASISRGLTGARRLLEQELGLEGPGHVVIRLLRVRGDATGYVVPGRPADGEPWTLVVQGSNGDPALLAERVVHQYAHAALLAATPSMPASWTEALATWVGMRVAGTPGENVIRLLEARRDAMNLGLDVPNIGIAAGNALWFAFLDEAYGPIAVRRTVAELGSGKPPAAALERALATGADVGLSDAFREFHVWTVLTGERSDGRHFSFAEAMSSPTFVGTAEWLPAISVRAAPAVASLGSTQVLLRPAEREGGMTFRFEGEFPAGWEADLLLLGAEIEPHIVRVDVSAEGRGEVTVPLGDLREVVLLVRNTPAHPDGGTRSFSWAAHWARGFPFEIATSEVVPAGVGDGGVLLTWETESERNLVGFDIIRVGEVGRPERRLNPIIVPAIGDPSGPTSYQFVDVTAEPGATYTYRVEGITFDGLRSTFEAGSLTVPPTDE